MCVYACACARACAHCVSHIPSSLLVSPSGEAVVQIVELEILPNKHGRSRVARVREREIASVLIESPTAPESLHDNGLLAPVIRAVGAKRVPLTGLPVVLLAPMGARSGELSLLDAHDARLLAS